MRRKIDFSRLFLYLFLLLSSLFLFYIGDNGEPFPLALSYAMMGAGLSLPLSALIGVFPSLFSGSWTVFFLYLGQKNNNRNDCVICFT